MTGGDALAGIEQKIMLASDSRVATLHPAVAEAIYRHMKFRSLDEPIKGDDTLPIPARASHAETSALEKGHYVKVGQTHVGIYGALGEVLLEESPADEEKVSLTGLVHVPQKIFPLVEFLKGADGMRRFIDEFFTQTKGTEWKGRTWNIRKQHSYIDVSAIPGVLFLAAEGYCFKIEKVRRRIFNDGRPLEQQVAEYEQAVKDFIQRIDNYVFSINPFSPGTELTHDIARIHYEQMEQGQMGLLKP